MNRRSCSRLTGTAKSAGSRDCRSCSQKRPHMARMTSRDTDDHDGVMASSTRQPETQAGAHVRQP